MFIDIYCYLEYVYERFRYIGSLKEFQVRYLFLLNFEGCIIIFCDFVVFLLFGIWYDVFLEESVWGIFGCYFYNVKYYNDELEVKIIQCLDYFKVIVLGEVGFDYFLYCIFFFEV